MIVRRRHPRLVVDMGEDLKAELGILVKQLEPARRLCAAIRLDEVRIREEALELRANLLPSARPGIALEDGTAIGNELIEIVRHAFAPENFFRPASLIPLKSARAVRRGNVRSSGHPFPRWPCRARALPRRPVQT